VLLDDESQSSGPSRGRFLFAGRLASTCEIALFSILGELSASASRGALSRLNSHELL
jgi:hypothetical protein